MVVGGIPQHGEQNGDPWAIPPDPFFSDVQIVDLSQQTRSCPNLTKYPIAMNAATGAIVSGHPMICGGINPYKGSFAIHSECYQHSKASNTWTLLTTMTTKRSYTTSVSLNGNLLVMGGCKSTSFGCSPFPPGGNQSRLSSTEYVSSDRYAPQPGPNLPSSRHAHCAVKLSTGQVMLLGGWPERKSVITFDPHTKIFNTSLPSLKFDREHFGCALFNSPLHDNREVVLAIGGWGQATAEVLDYTQPNTEWIESNYFYFNYSIL